MDILTKRSAKPFIKWAGGKTQLITQIETHLPKELLANRNITKYVEPFLGGGAIFFWLSNLYEFDEIYLYEINAELVNCYRVIKDTVDDLIEELSKLEESYIMLDDSGRKQFYYERRDEYNRLVSDGNYDDNIRRAALLIYLNKTCFNGLYRVNSKNEFNVPHGRYKNPKICDEGNLRAVNNALERAEIYNADFSQCKDNVDSSSFVYFDPPYRPLSKTASFTSYSQNIFSDSEQIRLKDLYKELDDEGAFLMLSNSDPKNNDETDNFFDDIYSDYKIERLNATRMINCNAEKRGSIKEILVTNY
ncbi:MAG: DNA adenine methylase [Candidatus Omnitrophica bacterium]|nr:DNA adenine methylase [Candidatus Omnitrophota bacterium]